MKRLLSFSSSAEYESQGSQGMKNSRSWISSCWSSLDLVGLNEDEDIKDPFEQGEDDDVVRSKILSLVRFLEVDGVDLNDSELYAWFTSSGSVLLTWFKLIELRAIKVPDAFAPVTSFGKRRDWIPRPLERRLSLRRPKNSFWTFPDLSLVLALAAFLENVPRNFSLWIEATEYTPLSTHIIGTNHGRRFVR